MKRACARGIRCPTTVHNGLPRAGEIVISETTVRDRPVAELVRALTHEGNHFILTNSIDRFKGSSTAELQSPQHKIICRATKNPLDCNQTFCAESGNCGECSARRNVLAVLGQCGINAGPPPTPTSAPLARLIYPLEPRPNQGWQACFAGLLPSGLGGVPATCAARTCDPNQVVTISGGDCACAAGQGPTQFATPARCFTIRCAEGTPALSSGPIRCSCSTGGPAI